MAHSAGSVPPLLPQVGVHPEAPRAGWAALVVTYTRPWVVFHSRAFSPWLAKCVVGASAVRKWGLPLEVAKAWAFVRGGRGYAPPLSACDQGVVASSCHNVHFLRRRSTRRSQSGTRGCQDGARGGGSPEGLRRNWHM